MIKENPAITRNTVLYAISRMLERSAYYGFRAIFVLYMVGEVIGFERSQALNIYGIFTAAIFIVPLVGGVAGDLLLGNKRTILIGGLTTAVGMLCLFVPAQSALYAGLALLALGSGLFNPNLAAEYGKLFLDRPGVLYSRFTLFMAATNLGTFIGVLIIGYISELFSFRVSFIVTGLMMLLALSPLLVLKKLPSYSGLKKSLPLSVSISTIVLASVTVGLFWMFYELSFSFTTEFLRERIELEGFPFSTAFVQNTQTLVLVGGGLLMTFIWNYYRNSPFLNFLFGCILGLLYFVLSLLIMTKDPGGIVPLLLGTILFLALAEVFVSPLLYTIITQYGNPKYLALLMSLTFIPGLFISWLALFPEGSLYDDPIYDAQIGILGMSALFIGIRIYIWKSKKRRSNSNGKL